MVARLIRNTLSHRRRAAALTALATMLLIAGTSGIRESRVREDTPRSELIASAPLVKAPEKKVLRAGTARELAGPMRRAGSAPVAREIEPAEPSAYERFPIGWYDALDLRSSLPRIAAEGMNAVMPYDTREADPKAYLDTAKASGIRVLLEVPRHLVRHVDRAGLARFVSKYKAHPALLGWYLADEPSMHRELGPLSAADATVLYRTIKAEDPSHPVAIAFGSSEDAESYRSAMDVMMPDDYPCRSDNAEFEGLAGWRNRMAKAAAIATSEDGFFPVIQAYSETPAMPLLSVHARLPTAAEERYMVFSALQMEASGLFFWTRYRSDEPWVDRVLVPIVATLNEMRPALAEGARSGLVSVGHRDVRATAFVDRGKGRSYIVAVHHGNGTVDAPIKLQPSLRGKAVTQLSDPPRRVNASAGVIRQTLGSFEVKVYRLTDA